MLLVIFCLIRPISNLFAKADFPDEISESRLMEPSTSVGTGGGPSIVSPMIESVGNEPNCDISI